MDETKTYYWLENNIWFVTAYVLTPEKTHYTMVGNGDYDGLVAEVQRLYPGAQKVLYKEMSTECERRREAKRAKFS